MSKTKRNDSDSVILLRKALRQFKKIDKEDLYGYSNIGLKIEKSVKKTQAEIAEFLSN